MEEFVVWKLRVLLTILVWPNRMDNKPWNDEGVNAVKKFVKSLK